MIGATTVTIGTQGVAPAVLPFVVGIVSAGVAYGRRPVPPVRAASIA